METEIGNALIGGGFIGLAGIVLLIGQGRIMGLSGIIRGAFEGAGPNGYWRFLFLFGALLGGVICQSLGFSIMQTSPNRPFLLLGLGGLFVGLGTALGSGCTSGHGVCGISRMSTRSITATLTFIAAGVVSVFLLKQIELGL